jgi:hypothetical protein
MTSCERRLIMQSACWRVNPQVTAPVRWVGPTDWRVACCGRARRSLRGRGAGTRRPPARVEISGASQHQARRWPFEQRFPPPKCLGGSRREAGLRVVMRRSEPSIAGVVPATFGNRKVDS